MVKPRRRAGARESAIVAVLVVGTAAGLGAAAVWAHPGEVVLHAAGPDHGWRNSVCSRMYSKSTMPLTPVSNRERTAVEVAAVTPVRGRGGLRVLDFVVTGAPVGVGGERLPQAAERRRTVPPGREETVAILVAGREGSSADGFDVTIRAGEAVTTTRVNAGMGFSTGPCS